MRGFLFRNGVLILGLVVIVILLGGGGEGAEVLG
jgi:hypothetical protein